MARSAGRTRAFRIVAGVFGVATVALTVPFAITAFTAEDQKIHAFHSVGSGLAFAIVLGVGLVLAAWKPVEMIAPFQVTLVASVLIVLAGLLGGDLIGGTYYVGLVVTVILVILHPERSELWRVGRVRVSELILCILWSVPAIAYALTQTEFQRSNPTIDPHVELHHYSVAAAGVFAVIAAALVASLGTRGSREAGWIAGFAGGLLGLASIALSDRVSAFDPPWAWLALLWGVAFVVASELEARRSRA